MPYIRDGIRGYLLAQQVLTDLLGPKKIIRPGVLQQVDEPPAILVKVVADTPEEWLNDQTRVHRARLAINCYGVDVSRSDQLASVVRMILHPMLKGMINGVNMRECSLVSGPFDAEDQPKDGSDAWMRHVRQDFQFYYCP